MQLADLMKFNPITIQCHNIPDADAIASGFALYTFFKEKGKDVRFIYAGRSEITKANLCLMVEKLGIKNSISYVPQPEEYVRKVTGGADILPGLLLTVDCQYGASNVARIEAEHVAVIDHHQIEITPNEWCEINPRLGSCSTLVWDMLRKEGVEITDKALGNALYYGLYTDTNSLSEIFNPLDRDMQEALPYQQSMISLFKNSNLSLKELDIAGIALIRHIYNEDYHYVVIKAEQCDPNILGLISDFIIQVAEVHACVVYNEWPDGIKFSTRSCVREVKADELAAFLAEGIGSGGGHREKAGGFINRKLYDKEYKSLHSEAYFSDRMNTYFDECDIIDSKDFEADVESMKKYVKKKLPMAYVKATDVLPVGTPITVRTLEGDLDMVIEEDLIIMIGIQGEVYPNRLNKFSKTYEATDRPYNREEMIFVPEYEPTIHTRIGNKVIPISEYAKICIPSGETQIYTKVLDRNVKVFSAWDEEKYMRGKVGDILAVRCDDLHDVYVCAKDIFYQIYEEA